MTAALLFVQIVTKLVAGGATDFPSLCAAGIAVFYLDKTSTKLREMKRVWSDAADDLKKDWA